MAEGLTGGRSEVNFLAGLLYYGANAAKHCAIACASAGSSLSIDLGILTVERSHCDEDLCFWMR